jgi:hypothetical protein
LQDEAPIDASTKVVPPRIPDPFVVDDLFGSGGSDLASLALILDELDPTSDSGPLTSDAAPCRKGMCRVTRGFDRTALNIVGWILAAIIAAIAIRLVRSTPTRRAAAVGIRPLPVEDPARHADPGTSVWSRVAGRASVDRRRIGDAADAVRTGLADGWARWRSQPGRWLGASIGMIVALAAVLGIFLVSVLVDDPRPAPESAKPSTTASTQDGTERVSSPFTDGEPAPAPSPISGGQLPGVDVYVNEGAGFLFSYPASWDIDHLGASDRLLDPTGEVSMLFEVAPPGSLRVATDTMVGDVAEGYEDVELVASSLERTPQGYPSLVVGGRGIAQRGQNERFLVITIGAPEGNRAITIRFSSGSEPDGALPVIQEIIASFRISAG